MRTSTVEMRKNRAVFKEILNRFFASIHHSYSYLVMVIYLKSTQPITASIAAVVPAVVALLSTAVPAPPQWQCWKIENLIWKNVRWKNFWIKFVAKRFSLLRNLQQRNSALTAVFGLVLVWFFFGKVFRSIWPCLWLIWDILYANCECECAC